MEEELIVNSQVKEERQSGIELLKIIAIFLITISHVVQSLDGTICFDDFLPNSTIIILSFFRYFGNLGNLVFLSCSLYFLIGSKKSQVKKIIKILLDVLIISLINLLLFSVASNISGGFVITKNEILQSIFPTTLMANWYVTGYLIILILLPLINWAISKVGNKLLTIIAALSFLLLVFDLVFSFLPSFFYWPILVILFAYLKRSCEEKMNQNKFNIILLIIGFVGIISLFIYLFICAKEKGFTYQMLTDSNNMGNVFLILITVGLFNIFRKMKFKSEFVNYIASSSLFFYVIHENVLVRTYFRPRVWLEITSANPIDTYIMWSLIYSIFVFFISMILSLLYKETLSLLTSKVSEKLGGLIDNKIDKIVLKHNSKKANENC